MKKMLHCFKRQVYFPGCISKDTQESASKNNTILFKYDKMKGSSHLFLVKTKSKSDTYEPDSYPVPLQN